MMSNKNFTITHMGNSNVEFIHANGKSYSGSLGNCGEAMYIHDADRKEVSTIPTNEKAYLTEADVSLAAIVISTIERNKAQADHSGPGS